LWAGEAGRGYRPRAPRRYHPGTFEAVFEDSPYRCVAPPTIPLVPPTPQWETRIGRGPGTSDRSPGRRTASDLGQQKGEGSIPEVEIEPAIRRVLLQIAAPSSRALISITYCNYMLFPRILRIPPSPPVIALTPVRSRSRASGQQRSAERADAAQHDPGVADPARDTDAVEIFKDLDRQVSADAGTVLE
jgi:hypothetical protein